MITKQTAIDSWREQYEADVRLLEARIDKRIRESAGGVPITVDVSGFSAAVRTFVTRAYVDGGWVVETGDDQREGPYMVLR